jgi:hypothetical protein
MNSVWFPLFCASVVGVLVTWRWNSSLAVAASRTYARASRVFRLAAEGVDWGRTE